MGSSYTRQSTFTDGDVIDSDLFNDEFDQILAAFASSTGHTHDGTTAEGGPITKLLGNTLSFGDGTTDSDIAITFNANCEYSIIGEHLTIKKTPAVTIVAACIKADTGVGPSMASGNQV